MRQLSPGQGAILELAAWGPHLLLYVTQRGGVTAWDTRAPRDAWSLPCAPARGLPEHLLADPSPAATWLMTGSNRGYLSLWDVRFLQCANAWRHPLRCPIDALALATGPPARLAAQQLVPTTASATHGSPPQPQMQTQPTGQGAARRLAAAGVGCGGGPSGGPLGWVAAGMGEAGLWDIVGGRCRQVRRRGGRAAGRG